MSYLTVSQVAEMLQVSPKTVAQWAREDSSIPVTRLGRLVRFEEQALLRWLKRKSSTRASQVVDNAGHALDDQAGACGVGAPSAV